MVHRHWNHTSPTEMPDSPVAERWRALLPAVSLAFGILASAVFALRVYASRFASCKIRAEDMLMGISVVLMWGTVASVLLSKLPQAFCSTSGHLFLLLLFSLLLNCCLLEAYNGIGLPGWEIPRERKHLLNLVRLTAAFYHHRHHPPILIHVFSSRAHF